MGCRAVTEPPEKITLAVMPWPASTPIYVAYENGYFRNEGLDVSLESYTTGHLALDAMLSGNADLATASDASIARAAMEGDEFLIIATIAEVKRPIQIIARKDRGITVPGDLRGKTIGLDTNSAAAYFLHAYMTTSYIGDTEYRTVDLPDGRIVDALLNGQVDAVATWAPYTHILKKGLGDNAISFSDRDLYTLTWNVTATRESVRANPERVAKLLRAILRADRFSRDHPEAAKAICSKHMGADAPLYEGEWPDYGFNTLLDESLILVLEDEARWMVSDGIGGRKELPNFVSYVYTPGLRSVRPEAVTIAGE
ncbi:MAG: hypothetical protein A2147_03840 [Chloroflexi bacterium RBG_16_57_8]|nr:MAG: hypothetical protein A2147_03840 [Chloroflexi bacterium RBG_16_57_8]